MAYKKNKKKPKMYRKKYSFSDRMSYYKNKANSGKTIKEQDYAYGYLDGMRGIQGNSVGTKDGEAGNKAGLRFWLKLTNIKL